MNKLIAMFAAALLAFGAGAGNVTVTSVAAQQRSSLAAPVDVFVTFTGASNDVAAANVMFTATNTATHAALPVVHVDDLGIRSGSGTTWTRKFIWNAAKDVGEAKIDDVALGVGVAAASGGVQLWTGGPFWAECNVGAAEPEEYGHYFWWGGTEGYTRNAGNTGWISVKSGAAFSFESKNCPTYNKSNAQLQSLGYIDSSGNLVAAHDAATANLGAPWRMPTDAEFAALTNNCDAAWTTRNGVNGRLVTGRGAYSSKSIFIPAAGYAPGFYFSSYGTHGYYWSSTPYSANSSYIWYLVLSSDLFYPLDWLGPANGFTVRPLRGFAPVAACGTAATHLALDCRTALDATVTSVAAQQRNTLAGPVEITVTFTGASNDVAKAECLFTATNAATHAAITVSHLEEVGAVSGSGTTWTRSYLWDAAADLGEDQIDDVVLGVEGGVPLGGVQLWEGGPSWAECNVGAFEPEEYGYYFQLGDTVGFVREGGGWLNDYYQRYTNVTWVSSSGVPMADSPFLASNCPVLGKNNSQLQSAGYIDSTGNLLAAHDAATTSLGAPWRMPTEPELSMLVSHCDIAWITTNGVNGRLVTGRGVYASKSIFLPAAGYGDGSDLDFSALCGYYWSSTPVPSNSNGAYLLSFGTNNFYRGSNIRHLGMSVRPVRGCNLGTAGSATTHLLSLDCRTIRVTAVAAQQRNTLAGPVDVTVTFAGASNAVATLDLTFSATNVATQAALTVVHIEEVGTASGSDTTWTRRFLWDAAGDLGNVQIDDVVLGVEGGDALGGVRLWEGGPSWAECNVGASEPEEYGYYFWWGDTVGYTRSGGTWTDNSYYSDLTWVSSAGTPMSGSPFGSSACPIWHKTVSQLQSEGYIDSSGSLVAAHDAATAHLGVPWRMPTDAEFDALTNTCTATWITRNGVNGRLVTGKGAYAWKSIFLPAAGFGDGSGLYNLGRRGDYWSSNAYSDSYVWTLLVGSSDFDRSRSYDCFGLPVRPVRESNPRAASGTAATHLALDCRTGFASVTAVTAQQRQDALAGPVDVTVTFTGASNDVAAVGVAFLATNAATHAALTIAHLEEVGTASGSGTTWTRRFLWNAAADLGEVKIDDVVLGVGGEAALGGVRLWVGGPYWAECNVGATEPEERGHYFWWGDTVGYVRNAADDGWMSVKGGTPFSFTEENCPTSGKNASQLQSEGYIDSTGNLLAAHDAATTSLGAPWRMPTEPELSMLVSHCDAAWITTNGVTGRLVSGRGAYASKSIFIPAAGYGGQSCLNESGSYGRCWSSTPNSGVSDNAWGLNFNSDNFRRDVSDRFFGYTVRPVRVPTPIAASGIATTQLSLDCRTQTQTTYVPVPFAWLQEYYPGTIDYEARAKQLAANGVNTVEDAYVAGLDPTNAASVLQATVVCSNDMVYVGWTPNLNADAVTRIYTVYGRTELGKGDWDSKIRPWHRFFKVSVAMPTGAAGEVSAIAGEGFIPEELGCVQLWENGPYWAECNVGATRPEEYGYYFWWGDTVGYTRNAGNTGWISVKDGTSFSFESKNCPTYKKDVATLQSQGYIDSSGNLVADHDAATANLGVPWRMPTDAEFKALVDNCTTMWTNNYNNTGVNGRLVTGKGAYSSKSIFLPAAGSGNDSGLYYPGSYGYYWSSTPYSGYSLSAWYLYFGSGYFGRYDYYRYDGQSVRPVRGFAP